LEHQLITLSCQARELSDEDLVKVVVHARAVQDELGAAGIWASAKGAEAERMLQAARREQERRNALAGRDVSWDLLLQALPAYDFMGSVTAEALAPFDIYLHQSRIFTQTGQYVLALRMIQDEPDQVERVAQGLASVGKYVTPLREREWDIAVERLGAKARSRLYLTIRHDGTAEFEGKAFEDIQAALHAIQQSHYWRTTRPAK
jgi:hypothetical protein